MNSPLVIRYEFAVKKTAGLRKVLFIDRDGTLIEEVPPTYQMDDYSKLIFYPHMFEFMRKIAAMDYELVMVSNQDGMGTDSFPENTFWPLHNLMMKSIEGENIYFNAAHIDRTFIAEHSPTRKPGIGMLTEYLDETKYNMAESFVIGDRITDMQLAKNLGCKGLWLNNGSGLGSAEMKDTLEALQETIVCDSPEWAGIYNYLKNIQRSVVHERNTNETKISIELNLDGSGKASINTGLGFFDHMLEQIAKHAGIDLDIQCSGDLHIDEHHSIEDVGIALGETFLKALGDKRGIERYGFLLPMDDCLAQIAIDFGGRNWIVWDVEFKREKIGEMPTEMFFHFFKSFSDAAKCNLNIKAEGDNEHHKIESVFKAFARAIKMAVRKDGDGNELPSTKGIL
ncbi:MAG: bifunctional histidinol-phosphatase/imidazoleglycerol-phosphate dehydratase HisB [Ferruginibacter sp.]